MSRIVRAVVAASPRTGVSRTGSVISVPVGFHPRGTSYAKLLPTQC
ncbi:hypothetical protein [Allokutzneria albata]|uniref:Uncharacterized protein n=1 Tax=Allokutzneria albata TaxID=211114 RepID=A0A1G9ZEZ8_ALLAB|nr:hypothetical protein [Allokutzneria albata]SDN19814.1 hypothetical protein SAMN04489726_5460 [Allokutzneria albata]